MQHNMGQFKDRLLISFEVLTILSTTTLPDEIDSLMPAGIYLCSMLNIVIS